MMKTLYTTAIRRTRRKGFAAACAVAAACAAGAPVLARPIAASLVQVDESEQTTLFPAQRGGGISLAQATAMAQSRFQGRVVRAETLQMGNRVVHEIRILGEDGRVRTVRIDAQTGAFL
jgi:hypothetical protein